MALGKYVRIDGHNSSRSCVTISIVVFASTCIIGAWMTMSSSTGPLGMGISLQQFMPKKESLSSADLIEGTLKVNVSRGPVQDDSNLNLQQNVNVTAKEPQNTEAIENHESESREDEKAENVPSAPNLVEKPISWDREEEDKGSEERNSGPPDGAESINQEVPTENSMDTALQTPDGDGNSRPSEGNDETEVVGEKEKMDDEYLEKTPPAWINAKNIQDAELNQTEKPSQEQSKSFGGESIETPSGLVSNDGKEMSNETFSDVAPSPAQAPKSGKEMALEGFSPLSHGFSYKWKVCNVTAGPDYIPCLDNIQAIKKLRTTSHYEHRERHCPDEAPVCLVPLPEGYKTPIKWPKSRDMIWFSNVPHTKLAEYKGGQNWVKVYDRYLTFPGGGTQFKYGALHYIDYLEKSVPDIAWGKQSRAVLDVGCGVASFGGYLFERDVITMSLAPKDEHEAQVQFALERGIPAISAVMGTTRLPFPSMVFDIIHCARCRVPWHVEGGKLLLELNRLLRPGGYFVWSATPVYRKDSVNVGIWKDMSELTKSICWELVKVERDAVNRKAAAIFRKPVTNDCYNGREKNDPPLCEDSDDPNRAWYVPLQACIPVIPTDPSERGSKWPSQWPLRLEKAPYWLKGNEASRDFSDDYSHWKHVITNTYLNGTGIDWSSVRNVMDMRASYGGFAAALKDLKVWVMNVVPVNSSDTLPIIYERGLFGIYHDWCESFSTYPRSYDLLHADHLFSDLKSRCNLVSVMAEVDRILRPGGWLLVRDDPGTVSELESIATSLHWKIRFTQSNDNEDVFCVEKSMWRPSEVETLQSAIG